MAANSWRILNTVTSDTGPTQSHADQFLVDNTYIYFVCSLGSGDTVQIQTRTEEDGTWVPAFTFTSSSDFVQEIKCLKQFRAVRTVDGTVGDSTVYMQTMTQYQSGFVSV